METQDLQAQDLLQQRDLLVHRKPYQTQTDAHRKEEKHEIAFKVMRLYKPRMQEPSMCLGFHGFDAASWAHGDTSHLILPDGFGEIYIGQVFSCYINVCNISTDVELFDVSIAVELEAENTRLTLSDKRDTNKQGPLDKLNVGKYTVLSPQDVADYVIEHELNCTGVHTLHVKVQYKTNPRETKDRIIRKHYRFEVATPMSFTARFEHIGPHSHPMRPIIPSPLENHNGKILAQITVTNQAKSGLLVSHIECIPLNDAFRAVPVTTSSTNDTGSSKMEVSTLLSPKRSHNFLFIIEPKKKYTNQEVTSPIEIGSQVARILTRWTTDFSEPGRLMSQSLLWKSENALYENNCIIVTVEKIIRLDSGVEYQPATLTVGEHALLEMQLTNVGDKFSEDAELCLDVGQGEKGRGILLTAVTTIKLGLLRPNETRKVTFKALAVAPGLHYLNGISIRSREKTYAPESAPCLYVI